MMTLNFPTQASMLECIYTYHTPNNYYMGGSSQLAVIMLTSLIHPILPTVIQVDMTQYSCIYFAFNICHIGNLGKHALMSS